MVADDVFEALLLRSQDIYLCFKLLPELLELADL